MIKFTEDGLKPFGLKKLIDFLRANERCAAETAAKAQRMAAINGQSSQQEINEKLAWLAEQGRAGDMKVLLEEAGR